MAKSMALRMKTMYGKKQPKMEKSYDAKKQTKKVAKKDK